MNRLMAAVPSGSYLVIRDGTNTVTGAAMDDAVRQWNEASPVPIVIRTPQQLSRLLRSAGAVGSWRRADDAVEARPRRPQQPARRGQFLDRRRSDPAHLDQLIAHR